MERFCKIFRAEERSFTGLNKSFISPFRHSMQDNERMGEMKDLFRLVFWGSIYH